MRTTVLIKVEDRLIGEARKGLELLRILLTRLPNLEVVIEEGGGSELGGVSIDVLIRVLPVVDGVLEVVVEEYVTGKRLCRTYLIDLSSQSIGTFVSVIGLLVRFLHGFKVYRFCVVKPLQATSDIGEDCVLVQCGRDCRLCSDLVSKLVFVVPSVYGDVSEKFVRLVRSIQVSTGALCVLCRLVSATREFLVVKLPCEKLCSFFNYLSPVTIVGVNSEVFEGFITEVRGEVLRIRSLQHVVPSLVDNLISNYAVLSVGHRGVEIKYFLEMMKRIHGEG